MHVWLKNEPLISCAINYPISHHINANTLRKTVNYAKNKGSCGYPKIEYSIWRYIACNKINIPEHVAWMYFETFYYISNYGTSKNMEFDIELAKLKQQPQQQQHADEIEKLKDSRKVDLYQFILHLYIQQFYSIDLKSSFMSREEWPVNRMDTNDRRGKSRTTMDEQNFLNFISKNLEEMISLYSSEKTSNQNEVISEEILQAFNFILEGSVDNMDTVLPFHLFLKQSVVQSKLVESKVYTKSLVAFLRNYLELNPFGLNNCLKSGRRISPTFLGGSMDPRKMGKIITNASFAPIDELIVCLTQVVKQTLVEISDTFREAGLYLEKCLYSFIYILQPLRSCSIKKCRKCVIFIGPTQRTLTVDSCVECTIISLCRRLIIRNCSLCTFYTLTPSSPILLSGCDNIKFAPYNSSYATIQDDARTSGLSDCLNQWDKPIVVTQNQSLINGSHWSLLDPSEFAIFSVPVESTNFNTAKISANSLANSANEIFGSLPAIYEQELVKRYRMLEENIALVQSTSLTQEQRILLQKFIEQSFKESLQLSGDQRELDHLALITSNQTNPQSNQTPTSQNFPQQGFISSA